MQLKLTEVNNEDEFNFLYKLFREIFPKDEDAYPLDQMKSWWPHNICLFIEVDNKNVGFILEGVNKEYKFGMIYYAGLIKEFRGKGIYPLMTEPNEKILLQKGAEIFISECEDPLYYKDKIEREIALKRLNTYVSKMGRTFIKNSPVKYLRPFPPKPGVDKSTDIQENYLLGFKVLGKPEGFDFLDQNLKNKITKKDYEKFFFYENIMEQDLDNLENHRSEIKSIDLFLTSLENTQSEYFEVINKDNWEEYLKENNLSLGN